jgi:hypothetical protein
MKELKVGSRLEINNWKATVIKIEGRFCLLKTDSGSQFCYGINGIKESQIMEEEAEPELKPGTQLSLI